MWKSVGAVAVAAVVYRPNKEQRVPEKEGEIQ